MHAPDSQGSQQVLAAILRYNLRVFVKPLFYPGVPVSVLRYGLRVMATTTLVARDVHRDGLTVGGVPAERYRRTGGGAKDKVVLYFHGGGYCAGSPYTHRSLTTHLARASGATVLALDYRVAPEAPYPAAVNDALSAYRALLDEGVSSDQIIIAGDSAGGGLSLACALAARNHDLPAAAGLVLLSHWADITNSERPHAPGETLLTWKGLDLAAQRYAGEQRAEPLASPLLVDLSGLPPALIITGRDEILLADSQRLASALEDAGGKADLHVYEGRWHFFPIHAGLLHDADHAIGQMAAFIDQPR